MPRYTIALHHSLPGHYRVIDTHTGNAVTGAKTWGCCEDIRDQLNKSQNHTSTKRTIRTEVLAVIAICLAFAASMAISWDDSKTYALNHGQESFE